MLPFSSHTYCIEILGFTQRVQASLQTYLLEEHARKGMKNDGLQSTSILTAPTVMKSLNVIASSTDVPIFPPLQHEHWAFQKLFPLLALSLAGSFGEKKAKKTVWLSWHSPASLDHIRWKEGNRQFWPSLTLINAWVVFFGGIWHVVDEMMPTCLVLTYWVGRQTCIDIKHDTLKINQVIIMYFLHVQTCCIWFRLR